MPSLREIVAAHAPLLLIDAASSRVQVGLFGGNDDARWQTEEEEAGRGLFRCLQVLEVDLDTVRAFAFCEGPGSVLGIRTTAMAVRTWCAMAPRPIFAYASLAVVAQALGRREVTVIADARRDSWHTFSMGDTWRRIPTRELRGELAMPEGFRHWSSLPQNIRRVPYALAELLPKTAAADLFRTTTSPDAFLPEEPSYVSWTPQIHRAPAKP